MHVFILQTFILWEICLALKYNFFADIAEQLPDTFAKAEVQAEIDKDAEMARLQQEIEQLKRERELLISLMKK